MVAKNLAVVGEDIATTPGAVLVQGRGQTGKSTFIRLLYELAAARGAEPVICDCDRTNASLTAYPHLAKMIRRPPSAEDDDVVEFLNGTVNGIIEDRFSALIDMGGGDQTLKVWARDLELDPFLAGHDCRAVSIILISPDPDGLSYLRDIERIFQPAATALVLNEGVVLPGRSVASAFEPIVGHEIFQAAVKRGGAGYVHASACLHGNGEPTATFF